MSDPPVVVAVFAIHAKFCVKAERRHDFLCVLKHYYIMNKEQKSNNNKIGYIIVAVFDVGARRERRRRILPS